MSEALEKEVQEQEEVDIISLLATGEEAEEEVEEEDDDDDVEGDLPETIEGLRDALKREREIKRKRNKHIRRAKMANHRLQEEADEYRSRLDKLELTLSSLQQAPAKGADVNLQEQIQEWQDRVADDPSQAIAYADWKQGILEDKIATYLGKKFSDLESKLGMLTKATDPDMVQLRPQIEALRKSPAFAELDDSTLLTLAKALSEKKIKRPRDTVAGGKPTKGTQPAKSFKLSDEERAAMGF